MGDIWREEVNAKTGRFEMNLAPLVDMIMKTVIAAVLGLALGFAVPARAHATEQCTNQEAQRAESQIDEIDVPDTDWLAVYRSCLRFKQCDDGAIAEGYSDAVVRLLANHWDKLKQFVAISNHHNDFKAFVLRHIDATTDSDDLNKIIRQAEHQCPRSMHRLCKELASRAREASEE